MKNDEFFTFQKYKNKENQNNKLSPSMEDYLEMIYRLYINNSDIRINLLSQKLNVRMSSTTKIIQRLSNLGYVVYIRYGKIYLTELGKKTGKFLYNRHNIIEKFLSFIMQDQSSFKDTEILEHYISNEVLTKINNLNIFFTENPEILQKYYEYTSH